MSVPRRIVSLSPATTEILHAIGAGERVAAVTSYCDYPEDAKAKPKVGGFSKISDALLRDINPDLVITSTIVQKDAEERFARMGIRCLHADPRSWDEVIESFRTIGKAVGHQDGAEFLIKEVLRQAQDVTENIRTVRRPRIYIEEWHEPPMVSGNWVPDMVRMAGGEYGFVGPREPSRAVTTDEVVAFDPEIAVLSLCGYGDRPSPSIITDRPGWQDISAVKNRRAHVINDTFLNRPGPRLVEGLRLLADIFQTTR